MEVLEIHLRSSHLPTGTFCAELALQFLSVALGLPLQSGLSSHFLGGGEYSN